MGAERYFKLTETIRLDLLELYGSGYVIDHCISAFSEYQEQKTYCIYITDALQALVNISGKARLHERWIDLLKPKKEETRTEEEVKQYFINGLKEVNK